MDNPLSSVLSGLNSCMNELRGIFDLLNDIFSEMRSDEAIASFKIWGSFGWTPHPSYSSFIFLNPPVNKSDADEQLAEYCTEEAIDSLFSEIIRCKSFDRNVKEAIYDFENEKYQSCALLLFSFIDGQLIRHQSESCYRRSGVKSYENIKALFNDDIGSVDSISFFTAYSFLDRLFENAKNFTGESVDALNRNFLVHGMSTHVVSRKDCIQLFLLYWNILSFLSSLDDQKEDIL